MDFKFFISVFAVFLAFVGYAPYVRDVLKQKTKPHAFTWFAWSVPGFIAFALQVYGGAGVGSWPLLAGSAICLVIFLLSLKQGSRDITCSDVFFLVLSLVALLLWVVATQPVWSVILITSVELFGFAPTIRKSWRSPYSETLFTYEVLTLRHALSIFALAHFNLLTALYPISLALADVVFVLMLILRRRSVRDS